MGGFGTYRLMARYPDLFARGFSVVGEPGTVDDQLVSMRNTPLWSWNAGEDELVNINTAEQAHADLVAAGVDHEYWLFATADHLTLAGNDQYQPGADWLGEHRVDRDPPTVAFVVDPREDSRDVVADHAYWLADLEVRDPDASPTGTIEVHSGGFGVAPATAADRAPGGGVLTGGQNQAMAYVTRGVERTAGEEVPVADVLTITATNVGHVTIDPVRARVSCDVELQVESDGPLDVDLAGCPATRRGRRGRRRPGRSRRGDPDAPRDRRRVGAPGARRHRRRAGPAPTPVTGRPPGFVVGSSPRGEVPGTDLVGGRSGEGAVLAVEAGDAGAVEVLEQRDRVLAGGAPRVLRLRGRERPDLGRERA